MYIWFYKELLWDLMSKAIRASVLASNVKLLPPRFLRCQLDIPTLQIAGGLCELAPLRRLPSLPWQVFYCNGVPRLLKARLRPRRAPRRRCETVAVCGRYLATPLLFQELIRMTEAATNSAGLKIYFCGSIRGGRQDQQLYKTIVDHLKQWGPVLTEHVAFPDLTTHYESSASVSSNAFRFSFRLCPALVAEFEMDIGCLVC